MTPGVPSFDPREKCVARGQGYMLADVHFYEFPTEDPDYLEVWCYTDRISYAPGETVRFHVSTTASEYSIEIARDGFEAEVVHAAAGLPGAFHPTPRDAYAAGCGWPVAYEWTVPEGTRSGGYVVNVVVTHDGETRENQHFFAVQPHDSSERGGILLVCATSTWTAYNEWGGSNSYWGVPEALPDELETREEGVAVASPRLNLRRPWSTGFVWLPEGSPRFAIDYKPVPGAVPRYPTFEFAFAHGLSKYYCAAGWAMFERLFVQWAEADGYAVDVITQHDLHYSPELLDDYTCVVIVGHDEYWTWEMRDAIEAYTRRGGNVARFGANFGWQVRFEDEGDVQVCHKLPEADPVFGTDEQHLLTTAWESPLIGRQPAETMGLNCATSGVHAHWAAANPRSTAGYTVYRPQHWVFEGTDLYFGDVFGSEARVFGYEVDGVKFTFREGLPYPTWDDGAPESLEILAMAPTGFMEENHGHKGTFLLDGPDGEGSLTQIAELLFGAEPTNEERESLKHGAGMMGVCQIGSGTVFNAGSAEWVNGLRLRDFYTERITRNVLDRFGARVPRTAGARG